MGAQAPQCDERLKSGSGVRIPSGYELSSRDGGLRAAVTFLRGKLSPEPTGLRWNGLCSPDVGDQVSRPTVFFSACWEPHTMHHCEHQNALTLSPDPGARDEEILGYGTRLPCRSSQASRPCDPVPSPGRGLDPGTPCRGCRVEPGAHLPPGARIGDTLIANALRHLRDLGGLGRRAVFRRSSTGGLPSCGEPQSRTVPDAGGDGAVPGNSCGDAPW